MIESRDAVAPLPFEPLPAYSSPLQDDALLARNRGKRIGILIVTYNALSTLTKVLKRITPNVWGNVEEIAVLDDASPDATYELAFGLKALRNLPKLQVLKNPKNLGYGGNQKAGYQYFIDKGFDIVVLLHGDGQYAPEFLSHVYHPIVTGEADAVFGSRMMKTYGGPLKGGMPLYKYAGNRILSVFENRTLGLDLTEFHSGYRAYSLHALRKIDFTHMTNDFHFDTEIIIKLHHQRYSIKEVPIPTYYGTEISYVNGMKYAADVVRAVYRYKQTCRSVRSFPEFQEYFIPYPIKKSKYSSHDYARRMAGSNQQVLEIACGEGLLAAELQKNGNRVTAADVSADLDRGLFPAVDALNGKKFDRVLLLDILEHLKQPEALLRQCHQVVNHDGFVIVSMPNVANITVRLMLLLGQFQYSDRGILDRRHVRFYTRKTARRLLELNGFKVLAEKMAVMPLELVVGLPPENLVMRLINRTLAVLTRLMPGLMGYQTVLLAQSRQTAASDAAQS